MKKYLLMLALMASSYTQFACSQEERDEILECQENVTTKIKACLQKEDYASAVEYLKISAENGVTKDQSILGIIYLNSLNDWENGVYWLTKAAIQENAEAQLFLGFAYSNEAEESKRDSKKALFWFEKAAVQGDASGQYCVGLMYYKGDLGKKDYRLAVLWLEKAANQNDPSSQYLLGMMYLKGEGVKKNYLSAFSYFEKAAVQDHSDSQFDLGLMLYKGEGVEKDYSQAAYWYEKSANLGNAMAQANLGMMYKEGSGVEKNIEKAIYWLSKSSLCPDKKIANVAASQLYNIYEENKHLHNSCRSYVID